MDFELFKHGCIFLKRKNGTDQLTDKFKNLRSPFWLCIFPEVRLCPLNKKSIN